MKALEFSGNGTEYFKIWIVNIFLIIVSLGLYYPWAKVRNRRYLYANTSFDNRNFEYHATGKQLFVSYVIAMAIFIAYLLLSNTHPGLAGIIIILFYLAIPWLIWQSIRFNLRMTSFSNVRFSFQGKLPSAYKYFLLLPIAFISMIVAVIAAVGALFGASGNNEATGSMVAFAGLIVSIVIIAIIIIFNAYLSKKITTYLISGYRYGQGEFATNLNTSPFVKINLSAFCLAIASIFLVLVIVAIIALSTGAFNEILALQSSLQNPEELGENLPVGIFALIGIVYIGMIVFGMFILGYVFVRKRTYIFANSSLDNAVRFKSTLKARSYAWVLFTNILIIICTLGLGIPWAKVRMTQTIIENTMVEPNVDLDSYLSQKQEQQSALADQLGDAFDVDIGLGF